MTPLLISTQRASRYLGCHKATVRRMIESGDLPACKIRASLRISYFDVYGLLRQAKIPCSVPACMDATLVNRLCNIPEIAQSLGVSARTISRIVDSGDLGPVVEIRKTKKIRWEFVVKYVQTQMNEYLSMQGILCNDQNSLTAVCKSAVGA